MMMARSALVLLVATLFARPAMTLDAMELSDPRATAFGFSEPKEHAEQFIEIPNDWKFRVVSSREQWTLIRPTAALPVWVQDQQFKTIGELTLIPNQQVFAYLKPTTNINAVKPLGVLSPNRVVITSARKDGWLEVVPNQVFDIWIDNNDFNLIADNIQGERGAVTAPASTTPSPATLGNSSDALEAPPVGQTPLSIDLTGSPDSTAKAPAPPSRELQRKNTAAISAVQTKAPKSKRSTSEPASETVGQLSAFDQWLFAQSRNVYTLQLGSFKEAQGINDFKSRLPTQVSNGVKQGQSLRDNSWSFLVYGAYPSRESAQQSARSIGLRSIVIKNVDTLVKRRCQLARKNLSLWPAFESSCNT